MRKSSHFIYLLLVQFRVSVGQQPIPAVRLVINPRFLYHRESTDKQPHIHTLDQLIMGDLQKNTCIEGKHAVKDTC